MLGHCITLFCQKFQTLAQQELSALKERIDQLTNQVGDLEAEKEALRREHVKRIENDRNQIASLQLELSRAKGQLEDTSSKLGSEKNIVENSLRQEQDSKVQLESQIRTLKTNLKYANEKVDNLTEELEEVRLL